MEGRNLRNTLDELSKHGKDDNQENFSGKNVGVANSGGAAGVIEVPLDLSAGNYGSIVRS